MPLDSSKFFFNHYSKNLLLVEMKLICAFLLCYRQFVSCFEYRLTEMPQLFSPSLDLSNHLLNISINVFVNIEAMLSPTDDAHVLAQLLQLLQASQVRTTSIRLVQISYHKRIMRIINSSNELC
jgi:hypothetical protein